MEEGEIKNLNFIKWFSKIDKGSVNSVGEKGLGLGELFQKKFPVPDGFVITTESYEGFLESSGLKDKIREIFGSTNFKNEEEVSRNCEKVKGLILKAEFSEELKEEIFESYENLGANKIEIEKGSARDILNSATEPVFVSVRSSLPFGVQSLSLREQNTYLNVKGNDSLLDHIKNCFASLFNPKTLMREFSIDFDFKKLKIAVIVQKMISAEKSGVVFSKNSSGNISVNAIWGIGEGINIKEISPDKYILSKELDLLDKKIGEKSFMVVRDSSGSLKSVKSSEERKNSQVLNNYEIQRIGDLAEKVEFHFGVPQTLEFSIDESGIYVLQTRETKTSEESNFLAPKEPNENKLIEEKDKENPSEILRVEKITKTKLKLVLDSPYLLEGGISSGLKKVGILKIEKIIEKSGKHPLYFLDSHYINQYENLIYEGIKEVSENFEEVWIRTSDFLSNEFSKLEGSRNSEEKNPLLGLHGIRFGLKYPEILEAEFNAIKRISEKTKVGVLIPNIVSIDEIKKIKAFLKKIGFESVLIGVIMETPAAVQLIKEICSEGVDSILININKLMQYLLAVDSSNSQVSEILKEIHPAFSYQIEYLVRVAKRNNVETNIFGDFLTNPKILEHLIKRGIDFVSVEPDKSKDFSERIWEIENNLLKGTDLEPRKYEMEKQKEDYLKKELKKKEKIKSIYEKSPEADKKLEKDLEIIEKEKKEYMNSPDSKEEKLGENLEESLENKENSEEVLHEELKENSNEEFDEGVEEVEEEVGDVKEKDSLGIF